MDTLHDDRRYLIPFRSALLPQIFTDVLVIGAGIAGMRAALSAAAAGRDVIVTAKSELNESNTYWAQGGVAAVLPDAAVAGDSFDTHIDDTLTAGGDLCDDPIVRLVIEQGALRVQELIDWGMPFDRTEDADTLALGREGGHTLSRVLHADGDATGRVLSTTLQERVRANAHVRLFDQCFVLDLITVDGAPSRCVGVITHHPRYGLQVIWAGATILASGGAGQVYRETTNPSIATGDGLALAYRAGAQLADMAFMQFHPTTLYVAGASRSLITEAVRGEGAHLIDREGKRFMPDYHEMAELAPRDVVSRAILTQVSLTDFTHVYLDCRPIGGERFTRRFPGIARLLDQFELDPGNDPIPVHPAAHYMIGGVRTDEHTRTSIAGLYACGEAACSGLNGANRLASNSLLEGLVFGEVAGRIAGASLDAGARLSDGAPPRIVSNIPVSDKSALDLHDVRSSLRSVMWRHVGIQRTGDRLTEVMEMIDFWSRYTLDKIFDDRDGWQVQNMLLVGALITQAAHWREESRGTHYRLDHAKPRDNYHVHELWQCGREGPDVEPVQGSSMSHAAR